MNRLVEWILHSWFSGLLDRSVMLISVKGRRTGREYTFPVEYVDDGDSIWVLPAHPERKTWWRNLDAETPIRLRLRGVNLPGTARAFRGDTDLATVVEGLRAYLRHFPRSARAVGINNGGAGIAEEGLEQAAERTVMVRVIRNRDREADLPGARGPRVD